MNFFELTDEQLEEVVGGDAVNYSSQGNWAYAPTYNEAAFAKNVTQTGSNIYQSNNAYQSAVDITKVFIH
jgi:hypothetical protein